MNLTNPVRATVIALSLMCLPSLAQNAPAKPAPTPAAAPAPEPMAMPAPGATVTATPTPSATVTATPDTPAATPAVSASDPMAKMNSSMTDNMAKNDAADAAAICEAVTRPSMRFVPVRSLENQAALMHHRVREMLVAQRTARKF